MVHVGTVRSAPPDTNRRAVCPMMKGSRTMTNTNTARRVAPATVANDARKARVTAQDVAMLMLIGGGVPAVAALHERSGIAEKTLDAAVDLLSADTEKAAALAAFRDDAFPGSDGVRGRAPARVGDVRGYRVQEVGETGAFIRLPVALLGLAKGDTASVSFADGRIVVTRA